MKCKIQANNNDGRERYSQPCYNLNTASMVALVALREHYNSLYGSTGALREHCNSLYGSTAGKCIFSNNRLQTIQTLRDFSSITVMTRRLCVLSSQGPREETAFPMVSCRGSRSSTLRTSANSTQRRPATTQLIGAATLLDPQIPSQELMEPVGTELKQT